MNAYAALFICVAGAVLLQGLQRAYFYLPKKELRRRAITSKPFYKKLQTVRRYGATARIFLTSIGFVFTAAAVIIASRTFDPFIALIFLAMFFGLLKFISLKNFAYGCKVAAAVAPYVARPLYYIDPLVKFAKGVIPSKFRSHERTKIYETEDLQDLLKLQRRVANNRISHNELAAALNALEFGGKQVKDYMVPRSKVHFVSAKDPIGPILLSELHKSGFVFFPVQGNADNEVVGMLYLPDLVEHTKGGVVSQAMDSKVFYIREDKPLEEVLQAFSKTGRHEFMVVDSEAQIKGLINLKEVLEQMVGHSVKSDFEDYDNPAAVSAG